MASTSSATPIPGATDDENPYEGNPAFSPLQAQVLNEYAKLNRSIKSTTGLIAEINDAKNDALLTELRGLERQMGLVLTLVARSWIVLCRQ
ncbi:hypothetical protein DL93DRAFT_343677 [Clavulina sp. PMI_390]|nr:hypothetical protein DL93DRAFT_343677 [Clavulina sp. PMI_390]